MTIQGLYMVMGLRVPFRGPSLLKSLECCSACLCVLGSSLCTPNRWGCVPDTRTATDGQRLAICTYSYPECIPTGTGMGLLDEEQQGQRLTDR